MHIYKDNEQTSLDFLASEINRLNAEVVAEVGFDPAKMSDKKWEKFVKRSSPALRQKMQLIGKLLSQAKTIVEGQS